MSVAVIDSVNVPMPRGYVAKVTGADAGEIGKVHPGYLFPSGSSALGEHHSALGIRKGTAQGSAVRHLVITRSDAKRLSKLYSTSELARATAHGAMVCPILADAGITTAQLAMSKRRNDASLHSGTISCPGCLGRMLVDDEANGATADADTMMMSRAPRKARKA